LTEKIRGSSGSGHEEVRSVPSPLRVGSRGATPPQSPGKYYEFLSKKCSVSCIFIAKNYLWPETGTGRGLNRPPGRAEDVKRTGGGLKI